MSPAEYSALADRYEVEQEKEYWRTGLICSVLANINRGKDTKAFTPQDFMPQKEPPKKMDLDKQFSFIQSLNAAFGGKEVKNG